MSNTAQIWATSMCTQTVSKYVRWVEPKQMADRLQVYVSQGFTNFPVTLPYKVGCLVTLSTHDSLTYLSCVTVNTNVIKFVFEIWACDFRLVTAGGHWAPWLLIGWLQPSLALIGWSQRLRSHWATAEAKRTPEAGARLLLVESRGQALSWLYPGLWPR